MDLKNLNIVNISVLVNFIYTFNAILIKKASYFVNIEKLILKFT